MPLAPAISLQMKSIKSDVAICCPADGCDPPSASSGLSTRSAGFPELSGFAHPRKFCGNWSEQKLTVLQGLFRQRDIRRRLHRSDRGGRSRVRGWNSLSRNRGFQAKPDAFLRRVEPHHLKFIFLANLQRRRAIGRVLFINLRIMAKPFDSFPQFHKCAKLSDAHHLSAEGNTHLSFGKEVFPNIRLKLLKPQ